MGATCGLQGRGEAASIGEFPARQNGARPRVTLVEWHIAIFAAGEGRCPHSDRCGEPNSAGARETTTHSERAARAQAAAGAEAAERDLGWLFLLAALQGK